MMKETIVFIHGYGLDHRIWSPLEIAFDRFNIIQLSLPGFGEEIVSEPYSITSLAQSYWMQLDFLKGSQIHLIGHSMGGYVCMEMLAQQPDEVASLCLVHSHVFADSEEKKVARSAAIEEIRTKGKASLVNRMIPSFFNETQTERIIAGRLVDRALRYPDDAWVYGMEAMRDRHDHSATLSQFSNPVLLLMGEKDKAVPIALAYQMAALSAQCKLCIYPETGHMGMYDNTAQMISDLITFYEAIL